MNRTLLAILLVLSAAPVGAAEGPWLDDPNQAFQLARQTNRLVLLHFWNEQCPPCRRVETFVFSNGRVISALEADFIAVKVNTNEHPELVQKYRVERIPQDFIFRPDGQLIDQKTSPQAANAYLDMLQANVAVASRANAGEGLRTARALAYNDPAQASPPPPSTARRVSIGDSRRLAPSALAESSRGQEEATIVAVSPASSTQMPSGHGVAVRAGATGDVTGDEQSVPVPSPSVVENPFVRTAPPSPVSVASATAPPAGAPAQTRSAAYAQPANTVQQPATPAAPSTSSTTAPSQAAGANSTASVRSSGGAFQPTRDVTAETAPTANAPRPATPAAAQGEPIAAASDGETPRVASSFPWATQPNAAPRQTAPQQPSPQQTAPMQTRPQPNFAAQPPVGPLAPQQGGGAFRGGQVPYAPGASAMTQAAPGTRSPAAQPNAQPAAPARPTAVAQNVEPQATVPLPPPVGLYGFCPVSLIRDKKWQEGDRAYGCEHRGRIYLFGSAENQAEFMRNPDHYAPVLSGFDPVIFAEQGKLVDGKREHGAYVDGRIILFATEESYERFSNNSVPYIAAVRAAMEASDRVRR